MEAKQGIKQQPGRHKTLAFERGTSGDQGQHKGYAASCETCDAVTFGGFRTKTEAKAALMHSDPTPSLTAREFLAAYAERSHSTPEEAIAGRVVATCACDYEECEGWQIVPEDTLLPWRNETVAIRG